MESNIFNNVAGGRDLNLGVRRGREDGKEVSGKGVNLGDTEREGEE